MFCSVCGQRLHPEDNFCIRCGAPSPRERLGSVAATAAASTTSTAAPIAQTSSTAELQRPLDHPEAETLYAVAEPAIPQPTAEAMQPEVGDEIPRQSVPDLFELHPRNDGAEAHDEVVPAPGHADYSTDWHEASVSSPQLSEPGLPQAAPARAAAAPQPARPKRTEEVVYDSTGTELSASSHGFVLEPAADIPTPSFGGYAATASRPQPQKPARQQGEARVTVRNTAAVASPKKVSPVSSGGVPQRKSRLPVLEILVCILLVAGAAAAVWMLRSSLPATHPTPASNVQVTITPAQVDVAAGKTFEFTAAVAGTDDLRVTWNVQEGDAGGTIATSGAKAQNGRVSAMAVYQAPEAAGTYHLLAISSANPAQSAMATITVAKPVNSEHRSRSRKK